MYVRTVPFFRCVVSEPSSPQITTGDDCLAIKGVSASPSRSLARSMDTHLTLVTLIYTPVLSTRACHRLDNAQNSTNIFARNITCRGGTGIAFGSLGQYAELVSGAARASSATRLSRP